MLSRMLVLAMGISVAINLPAQMKRDAAPTFTNEQARPWAKAIKSAVLAKKMPPWFADPQFGKFSNDASLSQSDINTLVAWVDDGARLGDLKDMPAPKQF